MSGLQHLWKGRLSKRVRGVAAQSRRGMALAIVVGYLVFMASPTYVAAKMVVEDAGISSSSSKTKSKSGNESNYSGKNTKLTTDGGPPPSSSNNSKSKNPPAPKDPPKEEKSLFDKALDWVDEKIVEPIKQGAQDLGKGISNTWDTYVDPFLDKVKSTDTYKTYVAPAVDKAKESYNTYVAPKVEAVNNKVVQPLLNDPVGTLKKAGTKAASGGLELLTGANLDEWKNVGDWDAKQWVEVVVMTGLNFVPVGKVVGLGVKAGGRLLGAAGKGLAAAGSKLGSAAKAGLTKAGQVAANGLKSAAGGISSTVSQKTAAFLAKNPGVGNAVSKLGNAGSKLGNAVSKLGNSAANLAGKAKQGFAGVMSGVTSTVAPKLNTVTDNLMSGATKLRDGAKARLNTAKQWNQEGVLFQNTKDYLEMNVKNPLAQKAVQRGLSKTTIGGKVATKVDAAQKKGWNPTDLPEVVTNPLKVVASPIQNALESRVQAGTAGRVATAANQLLKNTIEKNAAKELLDKVTSPFRGSKSEPAEKSQPASTSKPSKGTRAPAPTRAARPTKAPAATPKAAKAPAVAPKATKAESTSVLSRLGSVATNMAAGAAKAASGVMSRFSGTSAQRSRASSTARSSARARSARSTSWRAGRRAS